MRKSYVRKSQAVMDFIVDKMYEDGLLVDQVCKKYRDKCPASRNVYKWAAEDEEFKDRISDAYYHWHMSKLSELDVLSNGLASELYPDAEFREAEAALKRRIDTLKFALGKMAPVMTARMSSKQQVEHSGEVASVHIVNYGDKD